MTAKRLSVFGLIILFGAAVVYSCLKTPVVSGSNKNISSDCLAYWYDNRIIEAYEDFAGRVSALNDAVTTYSVSETFVKQDFDRVVSAYDEACRSLQYVILFDDYMNPESSLVKQANSWPANTVMIDELVKEDLSEEKLREKIAGKEIVENCIGLPAADYLLFSKRENITLREKKYVSLLTKKMKSDAERALLAHKANREKFIASTDFSVSGSLSTVLNNLLYNYEKEIRTAKVGLPIGIYGFGAHKPSPKTAENYYRGENISILSLRYAVDALNKFYYSDTKSSEQYGLRSILIKYSSNPGFVRPAYVAKMDAAMKSLIQKINSENESISVLASDEEGVKKLKAVYDDLQEIVGILKTDAIVSLGLTVTYNDGEEGD